MLLLHVLWFRAVGLLRREEGQTTAEYALVILAAAAVAVDRWQSLLRGLSRPGPVRANEVRRPWNSRSCCRCCS